MRSSRRMRWVSRVGLCVLVVLSATGCFGSGGERGWKPDFRGGDGWADTGAADGISRETAGETEAGEEAVTCGRRDETIYWMKNARKLPEDCEVYRGSFHFTRFNSTDLSGLPALRRVEGDLYFEDGRAQLETLRGLDDLERVGGGVSVIHTNLDNLAVLSQLRRVGGTLMLFENGLLEKLQGSERLVSVGGVMIEGNQSLRSLEGLRGLDRIRGNVEFRRNEELSEKQVRDVLEGVDVEGEVRVDE